MLDTVYAWDANWLDLPLFLGVCSVEGTSVSDHSPIDLSVGLECKRLCDLCKCKTLQLFICILGEVMTYE